MAMPTLQVCINSASNLVDVDQFGIMDPFCVVSVGGQVQQTRTHHNGGTCPVWNENFNFSWSGEPTLEVKVMDQKSMMNSSQVATGFLDLKVLMHTTNWCGEIPLYRHQYQTPSGVVNATLFIPDNSYLRQVLGGETSSYDNPQICPPMGFQPPPMDQGFGGGPYNPYPTGQQFGGAAHYPSGGGMNYPSGGGAHYPSSGGAHYPSGGVNYPSGGGVNYPSGGGDGFGNPYG